MDNIWGLKKRYKGIWENTTKGDILIFYASKPIGGIIGIGTVESKNIGESLLWPDEVFLGRVLYPLRINFKTIYLLKYKKWEKEKISIGDLKIAVQAGINNLKNEITLNYLLERISHSWSINMSYYIV